MSLLRLLLLGPGKVLAPPVRRHLNAFEAATHQPPPVQEAPLRPIVQLSGDWDEFRTEAGIPCGAVTGLTATMQKRIIRWLYCVPACAGKIKDATAKHYLALRLSLPRRVGMVIAANPSTLVQL